MPQKGKAAAPLAACPTATHRVTVFLLQDTAGFGDRCGNFEASPQSSSNRSDKPLQKQSGERSREWLCASACLQRNKKGGLVKAAQKSSARKGLWQLPLVKVIGSLGYPSSPTQGLQKLDAAPPLRGAICPWPLLWWQRHNGAAVGTVLVAPSSSAQQLPQEEPFWSGTRDARGSRNALSQLPEASCNNWSPLPRGKGRYSVLP